MTVRPASPRPLVRCTALTVAAALAAVPLAAAPAVAAAAVTVGGASFPPSVEAAGHTLVLNGAGLRVFFLVVDGYATGLYVPSPAHDAGAVIAEPGPKEIRTVFLHAASADQLRSELGRIHDAYCAHTTCPVADEAAYHALSAHETPVRAGETEAFLLTDDGVSVSRDGAPVLTIADPHFGTALLASMLGASSPTPHYRRALLGLAS